MKQRFNLNVVANTKVPTKPIENCPRRNLRRLEKRLTANNSYKKMYTNLMYFNICFEFLLNIKI